MSLAILFHFLCTQHVSDINIPIIRSLRLFCWITTLVVLFLVRCVLEFRCSACPHAVGHGPILLMMGIMMPETCWDRSLIINIELVASCWFSLFTFYWYILSSTCFGYIRPSSGALDVELQHMVFCTLKNEIIWSVCVCVCVVAVRCAI